jgi:hypothetical protein
MLNYGLRQFLRRIVRLRLGMWRPHKRLHNVSQYRPLVLLGVSLERKQISIDPMGYNGCFIESHRQL